MNSLQNKFHIETVTAVFIIALVSMLVLANFWLGFNLPLYALTLGLSILLILKYPRSGLYAIIFLTFVFERFFTLMNVYLARSEYKLYPLDLLLAALFFAVLIRVIGKKLIWHWQKVDWLFAGFVSVAALYFLVGALIFKNDFALAFSSFKYYVFYPLLVWATFLLTNSKEHLWRLGKFVLASGVAVIFFICYGILVGNGLWSEFTPLSTAGVRILAFTHAFYLSMASVVALVYVSRRQDRFAKLLWMVLLIWAVGIVGSMMRHLWIALAAAFVCIFVFALRQEKIRILKLAGAYTILGILTLLFVTYVAFLFPQSSLYTNIGSVTGVVGGRVTSIANSDDESIAWRSVVWKETIKEYLHDPVFGIGVGKKVAIEIGKYKDFVEVRNIHNSFLVLLVQLGFFGIGFLGATIWSLIKNTYSQLRQKGESKLFAQIALAILTLHLVAFLFQPYLETNLLGIFFWINLGVLRRLSEHK